MRFHVIETLDIRKVTNMLGRDVYVAAPEGSETLVLANSEHEAAISRAQRLAWGVALLPALLALWAATPTLAADPTNPRPRPRRPAGRRQLPRRRPQARRRALCRRVPRCRRAPRCPRPALQCRRRPALPSRPE